MRGATVSAGLAITVLALLLSAPPLHGSSTTGPAPISPHATGASFEAAGPAGSPNRTAVTAAIPLAFQNSTMAPLPAAAGPNTALPPNSALQVTEAPVPPATVPYVMHFLENSTTCCVQSNFTAPAGAPWGMVVLNYTGQAFNGVYDSSFRAYIDQVQVLFGTTPEYGTWFVSQDVTKYESLINGTFNFTFLLAAATAGGYFESTVSLAFYPPAAGTAAPIEPDTILPLFHRVFVSPTTPSVYDVATVPTDVVNATLEVWTYEFGPDEFWYAATQNYRNLYVDVDGQPIASVLPFPFIQTGGQDLFAWRPIPAVYTVNARPYEYDVTAALGMIEGSHNFTANVSGVSASSNWLIGGALLLYTNASVGAATQLSYRYSAPPPQYTSNAAGYSVTAAPSYSYAAEIPTLAGPENVSLSTNLSFVMATLVSTPKEWTNLTGLESLVTQETIVAPEGTEHVLRSLTFPLTMDVGQLLVITSTTGGSYPEYGNFTTYFLNGGQEWSESQIATRATSSGPVLAASSLIDNRFTGGANMFAGREELTGPNSALLLAITLISSDTALQFTDSEFGGLLTTTFAHELVGSSYQPPGPYNAETVLVDQLSHPLVAAVAASTTVMDVGGSVAITAAAGGGTAPYTIVYSGLPPGCSASSSATWSCQPSAAGFYRVSVVASDATGSTASSAAISLLVNAAPTVSPTSNTSRIDVGQTAYLSAGASGGTGALSCAWTVNGSLPVDQPCALEFSFAPAAPSTYQVTVVASDAGGTTGAPEMSIIEVSPTPQISVTPGGDGNDTVGRVITFTASVAGGTGNVSYEWFVNNSAISGVAGSVFTFVPAGGGSFSISVVAIDEVGVRVFAGPFNWEVHSTEAAVVSTSGPGPSLGLELLLVGVGAFLGGAAVTVVMRWARTRRIT